MLRSGAKRWLAALAVLTMVIATPAMALLVQPVFLEMRYSGVQSNAGIRVVNDRNRPVSVEVTVSQLTIPERGDVVFTPVEGEDFLIFPAVATIPANGSQIFRVRWIGDPALAEGQMFAFTTSELPLAIEDEGSAAVQLLYAIQTIVGIGPNGAQPDVSVASVERGEIGGRKGAIITFQNDGALHGQVNQATLTFSTPGWSRRVEPADVASVLGLGLVPAGGKRAMFVPLDDLPPEGELTVDADIPRAARS